MFAKMFAVILSVVLLGMVLLNLRQQRLDAMHDMASLHQRVNQLRTAMWDSQTRIAEQMQPTRLRQAIQRAGLELEPLGPISTPHHEFRLAHAYHASR